MTATVPRMAEASEPPGSVFQSNSATTPRLSLARSKRLMDLSLSLVGLILLAPVMVLVAAIVRLKLGRPVLFRQVRPGLAGEPFELVKFRTMLEPVGPDGRARTDLERLTPTGAILRRTSLDELPQLWNVLKGDMSLVGPRPLLMDYLAHYTPWQARRHEVRPGITGWAQVNGRQALSFEERFTYDVWYVDHRSFRLDLTILLRTIGKAFRGAGMANGAGLDEPDWHGSDLAARPGGGHAD